MKNYIVSEKLQKQLNDFQNAPILVGDFVEINKSDVGFGGGSKNPDEIVDYEVIAVDGDNITITCKQYGHIHTKSVNKTVIIKKSDYKIGVNPLKNSMPRVNFYNVDIWQLLGRAGYDDDGSIREDRDYQIDGVKIQELNWNPFVFDKDNQKQFYQRGFEWSLEQNQLLIESIYEQISIGAFIFRVRGYNEVKRLHKLGHKDTAFRDIVDGKQRLNALIKFVGGQFPDFHGNYFGDFSEYAKRYFMNYDRLSFGELGEGTSDKSTIQVFLNNNFAGAPMSIEHINHVKSIQI